MPVEGRGLAGKLCPRMRLERLDRRTFLGAVASAAGITVPAAAAADTTLHVLPEDNYERLRMDFNASRTKVRMLFVLSPT